MEGRGGGCAPEHYVHTLHCRSNAAGPFQICFLWACKRGIAESLQAQITSARLTVCEVGTFSKEISQFSKIHPPPSFRSHIHRPWAYFREITVHIHMCKHTCVIVRLGRLGAACLLLMAGPDTVMGMAYTV